MKWLAIAGILLYLTRHGDAAAVKCSPDSQDPSCASEKRQLLSPRKASRNAECLAGSEWESHCHSCRCSDAGVAQCVKQEGCELAVYKPIKCKPHTTFRRDCNRCTCLESGNGLCTLMECIDFGDLQPTQKEVNARRKRQAGGSGRQECKPNTTWKEDCNSCGCVNGIAVCTNKGCLTQRVKREEAGAECKDGSTWMDECNSCTCMHGNAICTRRECYQEVSKGAHLQKRDTTSALNTRTHRITKRGVCKSNTEFQIDCNPCKCAANGQSYTCTHNECLEGYDMNKEVEVFMESEGSDHVERHSICAPRDIFYIGCNPCHCNAAGTDYTCTNKPCPLPEDVEIFHELNWGHLQDKANNTKPKVVCVANRMFIMDCNTCWCNEDGTSFFCTRKVCTPEETSTDEPEFPPEAMKLKEVKKECRPNEVFEFDCNMCRCNIDGKSFSCTRRACAPLVIQNQNKNAVISRKTRASQQEGSKECQPSVEFRMDCNKCLCNDEGTGFSCTRMDCAAQNGNGEVDSFSARSKREVEQVDMKCVPDSVFDRGCNVCRCTAEGLHAVCSLKPCRSQEKDEPPVTTDPSFRCTPGDQFKRECNDCTCSADGKNVFCTLRLCDVELDEAVKDTM